MARGDPGGAGRAVGADRLQGGRAAGGAGCRASVRHAQARLAPRARARRRERARPAAVACGRRVRRLAAHGRRAVAAHPRARPCAECRGGGPLRQRQPVSPPDLPLARAHGHGRCGGRGKLRRQAGRMAHAPHRLWARPAAPVRAARRGLQGLAALRGRSGAGRHAAAAHVRARHGAERGDGAAVGAVQLPPRQR